MASQATFVQKGYGQVEPNHLSAQRTGQIYAQLPVDANISILENGQFVKYNYADGVVDLAGEGEWMLVFNEVKVYHEGETDKDFAMIKTNYDAYIYDDAGHAMPTNTKMVPRVFKTNIGDIFTTNMINESSVSAGATLAPAAADGILATTSATTGMLWQVVKVYTMPDGQPGVKLMRIQ